MGYAAMAFKSPACCSGRGQVLPDAQLGSVWFNQLKQDLLNETSRRVLFEALERRQLLSAELNPIAGRSTPRVKPTATFSPL